MWQAIRKVKEHWREEYMRRPDFFIVGAPKCGTTAMYQWLKAHPEVYVPVKEIHYFGGDLDHRRPEVTAERYAGLFASATTAHKAVGDVGVWYLMSEHAPQEIYQYNPEARIIIMLRRPVEMLYSLHSQLLYSGEEDITDFVEAIRAESDRAAGQRIPRSTHKGLEAPPTECLLYSRVASFADQIARYQALFDQVHIVLHDDIKADAALTYRKVLEFLGVDNQFQPDFTVVNPNTRVRSQTMRKVVQGLWFGPWRHLVPGPARRVGRRGFEALQALNTEATARPPLSDEARQVVVSHLDTDLVCLAQVIGRPLPGWDS